VNQKLVAIRHDDIKEKVGGNGKDPVSKESEKELLDVSDNV
jgi:hypothetical protein